MSERENVRKKKTRSRLVFALRINLFIAFRERIGGIEERRGENSFFFYTNDI